LQGFTSNLLAIQKLGRNREAARLWIESQRLDSLGFSHGTPLEITTKPNGLILRPAVLGQNHVSSRQVNHSRRPIIDIAHQSLLSGLQNFCEIKIIASYQRIEVTPSHRAFAIQRSKMISPPFRVLEVFAGGGTLTAALSGNSLYNIVAGLEIEPDFADEWQQNHPDALLVQADIRLVQSSELPKFDVLIGGIPCTSHSNLGRAKHQLAGKPELGDAGDLFLPVLSLVSARLPALLVFENVPAFASSLAGELFVTHLQRIGYHVFTTILQPNSQWGEIEDRKRWLLVATLNKPFALTPPMIACQQHVCSFLDAPANGRDQADAHRIAHTLKALEAHNARHRAAGHGFEFSVIEGHETRLPTIPKSYHKINTGPFVQTPYGPRLLRQEELERIRGHRVSSRHFAVAAQILGQGVQTRIFREIFNQLGTHLLRQTPSEACPVDSNPALTQLP